MKTLKQYSKLIAITLSITMILGIFAVYAASNQQALNIAPTTEPSTNFTTQGGNLITEVSTIEFFSASSPNTTEIAIGSASGEPGDTKTIPITISNNPGFSTFDFILTYDVGKLEPLNVTQGNIWPSNFVSNLNAGTANNKYIRIIGASANNSSADGTILNITFKIKDDAELGAANVSLDVQEFMRINAQYKLENLQYSVSNGEVVVSMANCDLGHNYVTLSVSEATCTAGGEDNVKCSRCEHTAVLNPTPALGHNLGEPQPTADPLFNIVYCERTGCDYSENVPSGIVPITSLKIDAAVTETVVRGGIYSFGLILNEGASGENVVWTLSDVSFALVDGATIYILNKTGSVRLIATDPVSGLSHSITLRIV